MMRKLFFIASLFLVASFAAQADTAPAAGDPAQVVQQTAKDLFTAVDSKKADLQKNPQGLYDLVGGILLPRFDFDLTARLVLGQPWRTATDAQRKDFKDAFYKYLVHGYADTLVKGNYTENNVKVISTQPGATPDQVKVRTQVLRESGTPVEVDYMMSNKTGSWKAFDVFIEGISYVHSYHDQFAPEVQQKGLDELIQRLNAEAAKGVVEAPAKAGN